MFREIQGCLETKQGSFQRQSKWQQESGSRSIN